MNSRTLEDLVNDVTSPRSARHAGARAGRGAMLVAAGLLCTLTGCSGTDDGGEENELANTPAGTNTGGQTVSGTGGLPATGGAGFSGSANTGGTAAFGGAGGTISSGGSAGAGGNETAGGGGGTLEGGAGGAGGPPGGASGAPAGGAGGTGDAAFDACVAELAPLCRTVEMDTAADMEASCAATEFIEIPLTGGGIHGPVTLEGGPYGAKIEWNEGAGTEFVNPVNGSEPICFAGGIDLFAEPTEVTDDLKNTRDLDYSLYTIFRPACMKEGETYPVITWANGTCGLTHGYAPLLATVASYGFVIIASNSTWTNTAPTNGVQLRALDFAEALNADPNSYLYQSLDLGKVGAMGHSQGAAATIAAASDPRIQSLILWNSGTSSNKPFLNVSADRDLGGSVQTIQADTNGAPQPGAWVWHHQVLETGGTSTGHLVLMEQPERVWEMTVAWWQWQLNGDQNAKNMFIGENCGLCNRDAEFEYGHNSLLQ